MLTKEQFYESIQETRLYYDRSMKAYTASVKSPCLINNQGWAHSTDKLSAIERAKDVAWQRYQEQEERNTRREKLEPTRALVEKLAKGIIKPTPYKIDNTGIDLSCNEIVVRLVGSKAKHYLQCVVLCIPVNATKESIETYLTDKVLPVLKIRAERETKRSELHSLSNRLSQTIRSQPMQPLNANHIGYIAIDYWGQYFKVESVSKAGAKIMVSYPDRYDGIDPKTIERLDKRSITDKAYYIVSVEEKEEYEKKANALKAKIAEAVRNDSENIPDFE